MSCEQATDTIVLHSTNLNVDPKSVVITNGGGSVVPVSNVSYAPENQFMKVKAGKQFKSGDEYILTIPFMGNITDDLVGYYRSSYVDKETNQTK